MKNVLITREKEQFKQVEGTFKKEGFNPISFPTIKFESIQLNNFNEKDYDYLIFTSKNAVDFFLSQISIDKSKPLLAVGSKTATYLKEKGFLNVEIPEIFSGEGLKEFLNKNLDRFKGKTFALIRALEGSDVLLKESGNDFIVKLVPVYKTVFNVPDNVKDIESMFLNKQIYAVVFSSPSTFKGFVNIFSVEKSKDFLKDTIVCVIGSTTAKALQKEGFKVDIVPDIFTFEEITKRLKSL
ncbi:uroporphyrinogen-III synthase [Sulfurihydrogenibium sp.]|uniref:uroporphyrinogen-III synthase n=1 Tax=Sulfurihydrogenibium sp. TaxID=2053621 RepID=UPI0026159042|nr:uroporphyrinogen-III synthase [Sulfurihydrogenibium sp.]